MHNPVAHFLVECVVVSLLVVNVDAGGTKGEVAACVRWAPGDLTEGAASVTTPASSM